MFKNFYTTQMSANAKQLQTRFTKMRSGSGRFSRIMAVVMTAAILSVLSCASVVMAAVGSDGLEHFDKNEVYIISSIQFQIDLDNTSKPEWIAELTSSSKLAAVVSFGQMRETYGTVSDYRRVDLKGEKGSKSLYSYSAAYYPESTVKKYIDNSWADSIGNIKIFDFEEDYQTRNEVKQPSFSFVLGFDKEQKNISSIAVKLTETPLYTSEFLDDYETYTYLDKSEFVIIGGLEEFLTWKDMFPTSSYYSYYDEKSFSNKKTADIDINVLQANEQGIVLKTDVKNPEADKLHIQIRECGENASSLTNDGKWFWGKYCDCPINNQTEINIPTIQE